MILLQIQQQHPPDGVNRKERFQQTLQKVARLRKQHSLPSLLWIIAAPLVQVNQTPSVTPPASPEEALTRMAQWPHSQY